MIWTAILELTWFIFVQGPLQLIAAFNKVLEYLTGGIINDILFGSEKDFHWNKVPLQFWWFVIVSICMFVLIFIIQMIILIFQEASETKTKFVLAMQNGVKAFGFMFLIPIFFFIANFIVQSLANTVISNFGNGSNIAKYLWHIGDPSWDGSSDGVPSDYGPPNNIDDYNLLAQIFGVWFMLFAMFMIGIILIQKIIELFFLFVISPVVMIVMVIDNGKAAFTWKDMVIAKFLASTGTLIGYYIFISVTQILLSSDLSGLDTEPFFKTLFIILFLCGGGLATIAFSDMVAAFVGESVGMREGMSSFKSTVAGGMAAMNSAKMVGKAMKYVGRKTTKSFAKVSNFAESSLFNNSSSNNVSDLEANKSRLNFNPFRSATNTMSSRSGIVGLAGAALGNFGRSLGNMSANVVKAFEPNNDKNDNEIIETNKASPKKINKVASKNFKVNNKTRNKITKKSRISKVELMNKKNSIATVPDISGFLRSEIKKPYLGSRNNIKFTNSSKSNNYHKSFRTNNVKKIEKPEVKKIKQNSPQEKYLIKLNKKVDKHQKKSRIKYDKI